MAVRVRAGDDGDRPGAAHQAAPGGPTRTKGDHDVHASTQPTNPQRFALDVTRRPDAVVVSVAGEVDAVTAPELRRVLGEVLHEPPAVVVVDLRGVVLLASAGLAALIAAHDQAVPETRLRIVATDTTPAMRSVQLTGLGDLLVVHPTLDQALAAG